MENNLIERVRSLVARMAKNREFVAHAHEIYGEKEQANEQKIMAMELNNVYMLLTNPQLLEEYEEIYGLDKDGLK